MRADPIVLNAPTGPSLKHSLIILISIASLFLAWPLAFDWVRAGGNLLNPVSFFMEPYRLGSAPAFLAVDIAVAWIAYMVWVVPDARSGER